MRILYKYIILLYFDKIIENFSQPVNCNSYSEKVIPLSYNKLFALKKNLFGPYIISVLNNNGDASHKYIIHNNVY